MNFLAGLLLLFASEESTFWLLSTIVEEILPPDYYTPLMTGIRVLTFRGVSFTTFSTKTDILSYLRPMRSFSIFSWRSVCLK